MPILCPQPGYSLIGSSKPFFRMACYAEASPENFTTEQQEALLRTLEALHPVFQGPVKQ
jgi:hypothetical protein